MAPCCCVLRAHSRLSAGAPNPRAAPCRGLSQTQQAVSGHNWGNVQLAGSSLQFMVDGKVAFEVPLPDVSQVRRAAPPPLPACTSTCALGTAARPPAAPASPG